MSKTFAEDDLSVFEAMMPKTAARIREHLKQQQATIAKLQAELARLKAENDWVSVGALETHNPTQAYRW
jgi:uncharacterized small protein (DUF1192 family)